MQGSEDKNSTALRFSQAIVGQRNLTVTTSGLPFGTWTTVRAVGQAYQTENGTWRMRFNVSGNGSTNNNAGTFVIAGTVFKNIPSYRQAVAVHNASAAASGYTVPNTGEITVNGGSSNIWGLSGDVELESKPSWA